MQGIAVPVILLINKVICKFIEEGSGYPYSDVLVGEFKREGNNLFQDGFPNTLRDDVSKVASLIPFETYCNISFGTTKYTIEYIQDSDAVKFPYRIYYTNVSDEAFDELSIEQKIILHCIYTRSCDGFVRQKHLEALLQMDYPDWAIPYIVKVCDEYVIQILEITYDILKGQDTERFKRFCFQNHESISKSFNRMVSYWNEYYRYKYKVFDEYIGQKLFRECFGYSHSIGRRN